MKPRQHAFLAITALAALTGACANGGDPFTTASVTEPKTTAVASADPTCLALSNQIANLRGEGSVERLEKAAEGKSTSVKVKRTALAKQAELNRVYAEFQSKCGPKLPQATTASAPAQPVATQTASATAPTTTAPKN